MGPGGKKNYYPRKAKPLLNLNLNFFSRICVEDRRRRVRRHDSLAVLSARSRSRQEIEN